MPWGLKRYQETGQLHFLTFSCYHRQPKLMAAEACAVFEGALERTRQQHGLQVYGYVLMPEHVHMLVSEPESGVLARAMLSLKQSVSRTLALRAAEEPGAAPRSGAAVYGSDVSSALIGSPVAPASRMRVIQGSESKEFTFR